MNKDKDGRASITEQAILDMVKEINKQSGFYSYESSTAIAMDAKILVDKLILGGRLDKVDGSKLIRTIMCEQSREWLKNVRETLRSKVKAMTNDTGI